MKKGHETGTPWRLGLLEYLCTPLDENTPSPSSLHGRQFKGLCPIFNQTNSGEGVLEKLINKWLTEKLNHDRRSRTLEDIPTGSTAAVLDNHSNTWTIGQGLDRNEKVQGGTTNWSSHTQESCGSKTHFSRVSTYT